MEELKRCYFCGGEAERRIIMAEKSNLEKILNLENDEEFEIQGSSYLYRIHNGERQFKVGGEWYRTENEGTLTNLINNPSRIIRKPRFSDEEMTFLRLLRKYGKVSRIHRSGCSTYFEADDGDRYGNNIGELLKPDETIDLDELFKEEENG